MTGKKRGAYNASSSEIAQLLIPQIRFLRAAGVTLVQAERVLRAEFRRKIPKSKKGRVERVRFNNECARLIANWKVLPDYLDSTGYPQDLKMRGRGGFLELARLSAPGVKPSYLLHLLHEFGSAVKLPSGRLRLKTKAFLAKRPAGDTVAYEPNMQFMIDTARVIEDQLGVSAGRSRGASRFWRAVDNHWIPERYARGFLSFSKRRAMELMEEIEDWLDEHEISRESGVGRNLRRLGVGAFSISEPSSYSR
jgi:hypothetical protein